MPAHRIPLAIRFWQKVVKSEGCWEWTGAHDGGGYGHIKVDGKMLKAHRISYEWARGEIPPSLDIDHLCRNRSCVNPAHMEPVPRRENTRRGEGATAQHGRKTHCKRGHEFTPENTYRYRTGRICRTCRREYNAKQPRRLPTVGASDRTS